MFSSICELEAKLWKLVEGVQGTYPLAKLLELEEIGGLVIRVESRQITVHEDNMAAIIISYAGEGRTTNSEVQTHFHRHDSESSIS